MITDLIPPESEPITLDGAKLFLRIDHDEEDMLISDLIQSAREQVESLCARTLIQRQQQVIWTAPFQDKLKLPTSPVTSVLDVNVYEANGQEQIITDYQSNLRATPPSLCFDIPSGTQTVVATIEAGYGGTPEDVPMPLRQAMLLLIGQGYEARNGQDIGGVPMMVDALIMPYRSLKL